MRRRYDWTQLVPEFESSRLTQVEFAKRQGIKLTTFRQGYYAARKRLRGDSTRQSVRFLPPVKVSGVSGHVDPRKYGEGIWGSGRSVNDDWV